MQKRILVVAREADVVETIPITLQLAGHRVELADCGLDAILWAERLAPDLVLVDASLPDMDGPTVIKILSRLPSTAALGAILLKPRWRLSSLDGLSGEPDFGALNSRELLLQVGRALSLCHQADHRQELALGEV